MRIGTRIVVGACGLIVAVGLVVAVAASLLVRGWFHEQELRTGSLVAAGAARNALQPRLANDRIGLQQLANQVLESWPDLAYVYFLDAEGRVAAHTFAGGFPRGLAPLNRLAPGDGGRALEISTEEGLIDDFAAPIVEGRLGEAHVGISHTYFELGVRRLLAMIAGATAVVLLIGGIVAFLLSRVISRPLEEMTRAAARVGDGRLDERVPVRSGDEVGRLATTFNAMVEDLRESSERQLQVESAITEQLRLQRLVAGVGIALAGTAPIGEMLRGCTEALVQELGAALARIWLLEEGGGTLALRASSGMYTHLDGAHARMSLGEAKIGKIGQERQPHLTNDVQSDPLISDREWARREGLVAFAGHPLVAGGRLVGVMGVFARTPLPEATLGTLGVVAGLVATGVERRVAEEDLRRSREFIRQVVDSVDEGFVVIDRDLRILDANRAYCRSAGRACEAVLGRHCYEVSHGLDRPCGESGENCPARAVFATGRPAQSTHTHPDAGGSPVHILAKAFPLSTDASGVASVIETVTNVTERFLLEEQRLKAQKLESIGTLAGGIAHDFNNLLQGVFGYISLARASLPPGEKAGGMLEQAERALGTATGLTTQLLTFSKGGLPTKRRVQLGPLLEDAVRFSMSGSSSAARVEIEEGLRAVDVDEGQIGQVVQNLVLNALDAMPEGGTVTVSARNLGEERPAYLGAGKFVELSVRDAGQGIPAEDLSRIFDPYFTTKTKGSGLGLATAYSIVRNHGGAMDVTSVLGKGSTLFVYLPASESEAPDQVASSSAAGTGRPGRVLLMDDEEVVRQVGESMLSVLGNEVEVAGSGEEALEKYRQAREKGSPFDAVILDLTIRGGMGGKETMRRLREIDPGVRAIVSSGYSDDAAMSSYGEYGFRACLTKPYRIDNLREALASVLS